MTKWTRGRRIRPFPPLKVARGGHLFAPTRLVLSASGAFNKRTWGRRKEGRVRRAVLALAGSALLSLSFPTGAHAVDQCPPGFDLIGWPFPGDRVDRNGNGLVCERIVGQGTHVRIDDR